MATGPHIRRIATEEAFAIPEQFEGYRELGGTSSSSPDVLFWHRVLSNSESRLPEALLDLDEQRIADMGANGVDVQLLLLTSPGVQIFDADTATGIAERANDLLAEAISRHRDRYAGLAVFAPQDPRWAVVEMRCATSELGLNERDEPRARDAALPHGARGRSHHVGDRLPLPADPRGGRMARRRRPPGRRARADLLT